MKGVLALFLAVSAFLHAAEAACGQAGKGASIQVGILWWPADPEQSGKALKSDLEDCLVDHIRLAAPEVEVVRQQAIRDALFPLLEPATQPVTEEGLAALFGRDDVRKRLTNRGLRYLIVFSGGTDEMPSQGGIVCGAGFGAGGCFGYSWQAESTRLDAVVWPLGGDGRPLHRERADAKGTTVVPAFILPVPISARSRQAACRELGRHLGQAIRKIDGEPPPQGGAAAVGP